MCSTTSWELWQRRCFSKHVTRGLNAQTGLKLWQGAGATGPESLRTPIEMCGGDAPANLTPLLSDIGTLRPLCLFPSADDPVAMRKRYGVREDLSPLASAKGSRHNYRPYRAQSVNPGPIPFAYRRQPW